MITERIAGLFQRGRPRELSGESRGNWSAIFDWLDSSRTSSGQLVNAQTAMRLSAVFACVRVLSETLGQLPWHMYENRRNGAKQLAPGHQLSNALKFPNTWQNSVMFREMGMSHLCLAGNFYAEILPGINGSASRLEPLHPSRMYKIERQDNGELKYHYREPNSSTTEYLQRDILHIPGLAVEGFYGLNPIEVARESLGNSIASDKYACKYFENDSKPSGLLTTDNPLKKETAERNRDMWQRANSGEANWHKVAVLTDGLKWQPISLSNRDSQFLETRQFNITDIARIFRVPPHMIGDLSRSTFSNIEQQAREFVDYTMMPWVRRWEEAFAQQLIVDPDRYYLKFELGGLLRGDSAARGSYYSTMINAGVMMPGEARELEDLNRVPGDDKLLVQGAMILLEDVGKEPESPPQPEPPPPADGEADPQSTIEEQRKQLEEYSQRTGELAAKSDCLLLAIEERGEEIATLKAELSAKVEADVEQRLRIESLEADQSTALAELRDVREELLAIRGERDRLQVQNADRCRENAELREQFQEVRDRLDETIGTLAERESVNSKLTALAKQLLTDHLERLRKIEREAAIDAAAKPEQFMEWLAKFYDKHAARCSQHVVTAAELYASLAGVELDIVAVIAEQIETSKERLQAIYDTATPDGFADAVKVEVETWEVALP